MCGIAGIVSLEGLDGLASAVERMSDALRHRGPDASGVWLDSGAGVALGHRRLSILDLSPAGAQPMVSRCGRYVLTFNGEIYNHLALRAELEGPWRGHSDTETLLAAFSAWGLEATLSRTVGMFALGLWDREERTLYLARDRFGEKPLYYGWSGSAFLFGSELKALKAYPGFANPLCREALAQYLRFVYVPAPFSIYRGIYKVEPGCVLALRVPIPSAAPARPLRPGEAYGSVGVRRWWSLSELVASGAERMVVSEDAAREELELRLREAVRLQSLSDVPLGAFLSGGVDSSTIVALMQQQSARPVQTFTVGLEAMGMDESPYARAVARHLGTAHSEFRLTVADAQAVVPLLPAMYDEPFGDSSQIPTHLICVAARRAVTVALSGDAGDELFGGYNRYFWGPRVWSRLAWLPWPLRRGMGSAITSLSVSRWDALGSVLRPLMPGPAGIAQLGDKAHKLAARLEQVRGLDDLYRSLITEWPAGIVREQGEALRAEPLILSDALPLAGVSDARERMMYWDSLSYLPDDILCKVDRAAMAVGLETRVPFLDHRVVEWAWRLPLSMKIRGNTGKWMLRQVLYRHVPKDLIERPKAGFAIPVGQWLRGPLRPWAEALLDEARLRREGYLDPIPIRAAWGQHLSGDRDWTPRLWAVLMFQSWLEENP